MRLFYCDHHPFPLPAGHKFPLEKYALVRQRLASEARFDICEAPFAAREELLRVHTADYIDGFTQGTLDPRVMRRIGFPWSPELVRRTLASAGGTLAAVRAALQDGFAGSIAGGTHHAFREEGAGFCVFNDLAIATQWSRCCAGIQRVAIVDLDVHQGDGTAKIFEGERDVFTLSLHGGRNFPFRKQQSRLDVAFDDGVKGPEYLEALGQALERIWLFQPQLILYQAGVDGLADDRLGRMQLQLSDLAVRDRRVLEAARERSIPVAMVMGGGYGDPIEATVAAHAQTFLIAASIWRDR